MTNELEKQFFKEFDIKPKDFKHCDWDSWCPYPNKIICDDTCPYFKTYMRGYPEITPNILLKLICILGNTSYFLITDDGLPIDVDGLKKSVLHSLTLQAKIDKNKGLKHQVRTIFKEG